MRFIEFKTSFVESTLQKTSTKSWVSYLENLINSKNIGIGPQGEKHSGLELSDSSKSDIRKLINDFQKAENKKEIANEIENTKVTFTNKLETYIKFIHKSAEIKGGNAFSGKEKKPWNEGEVAETILGAALFARFTNKGPIDEDQVREALKEFVKSPVEGGFKVNGDRNQQNPIEMTAKNKMGNNAVIIEYVNNYDDLESKYPQGVAGLNGKVKSCAAYVNESDKVREALEKADSNAGNLILIKTDGVGDQKGTKADLQIQIGQFTQLLSLKVNDIKQFGQESGSSWQVITSFFQRFVPDLDIASLYQKEGQLIPWNPETGEGWPDIANRKTANEYKQAGLLDQAIDQAYKLIGEAYSLAEAHINDKLSTAEGAAEIINGVYNGIIHHAQGNNQDQTLVILDPSTKLAWKELEFGPKLLEALQNYRLEVSARIAPPGSDSNHRLRVFGRPLTSVAKVAAATDIDTSKEAEKVKKALDSNKPMREKSDPEMLFQLRSYVQESGAFRNPIEMGDLLKDITEVQKIQDAEVSVDNTDQVDTGKVQNQEVPINIINAVIRRHQLPIQQKPQIIAQANELLKAGYNFNQIEQELVNQFAQQQTVQQPVEPVQQEPVEPVQQEPVQSKQRLGHLRQGSEEQNTDTEQYPQKIKESDDQVLAMIRRF
jgi:hypothetical protein